MDRVSHHASLRSDAGGLIPQASSMSSTNMSDSDNLNTKAEADREHVIRHAAFKGYQAFSLLTPPLYAGLLVWRKGRSSFSIARVLRATWIGSFGGAALGGTAAWGLLRDKSAESIHDRSVRLHYNITQRRVDDYSTIGAVLSGVLTPAIFWNRARIIDLVLGGLAFGSSGGVIFHLTRSFSQGESVNPEGMSDVLVETDSPKP